MSDFGIDIINLYSKVSSKENLNLSKKSDQKNFIKKIESDFEEAKENPITIHGLRTEELFRYVVIGLGKAKVLKKEDTGEIYSDDDELIPPDYSIINEQNQKLFVEVKNFYQKETDQVYRVKKSYVEKLLNYANLHSTDLKFAIFWTRWKLWSLNRLEDFTYDGEKYFEIELPDAIKLSEMGLIGDYQIGTTPPLKLKFIADKSKPRDINDDGEVEFTIGEVQMLSNETIITDENEKKIAFYLMLFSDWDKFEDFANINDENQLESIEMVLNPRTRSNPKENFEMMGFMSSLISIQYNQLTSNEGEVEKLRPQIDPENIGVKIGKDYSHKDLPLWLFLMSIPDKET